MLQPVFVIIFIQQTLSWCQISGKSREEFTVIELAQRIYNNISRDLQKV